MFKKVKRVLAIHDLCSFGKCSLGIVIPVISSMGIEVCPLPTALFSSYLIYKDAYMVDFTEHMKPFIKHFAAVDFHVNALYSGFLGSLEQIRIVRDCAAEIKPEFVLVDPVMGDNGKLYSIYNEQMVEEMKELVSIADLITPNLTEARLLTGMPNGEPQQMAKIIFEMGAKAVVITGLKNEDRIYNCIYEKDRYREQAARFYKANKSGTGDLFASVLLGKMLGGENIDEAIAGAAEFLYMVLKNQDNFGGLADNSVFFEPFLKHL